MESVTCFPNMIRRLTNISLIMNKLHMSTLYLRDCRAVFNPCRMEVRAYRGLILKFITCCFDIKRGLLSSGTGKYALTLISLYSLNINEIDINWPIFPIK